MGLIAILTLYDTVITSIFEPQKKKENKILVNNPLQVDKIKFLLFPLMNPVTVIIYVM